MRWNTLRLDDGPEIDAATGTANGTADSTADGTADGAATGTPAGTRQLPLLERRAVARTFDTPEFRGVTCYEVHARSIINRVPESSRMSFGWTINPYRGCTHACVYCMSGDTRVNMADGGSKALSDVRVGDAVYGTVGVGRARRFVASTVLAHWRTRAVAYRIGLDDGGTLTAGADHRLLTERGWVFVAPSSPGSTARSTRPFLTAGDRLVGPGAHGSLPAPGMPVPPDARRTVLTVRQLDGAPRPMFDITTATGDYLAAGVVSHNCFARNTHTYLDLDAGLDFDSRIVVKVNAVELLRRELARPSWRGGHIAMGTNVDCYQRAEGRYQLMPGIIGALTAAGNPFSILTKGTLMLRDLDLLMAAAERTSVSLAVSVGLTDTDLWRLVEPGTPAPHRRLAMCAALREAGLRCGVLMAPILPFLSDSPSQLRATVAAIARAGASSVTPLVLHLRPGAREWFFGWLGEHHPGLLTRYQALYGSGSYAPSWYTERVAGMVLDLAAEYRIGTGAASTARGVRGGGGRGGRLDEMPSQDADDAGGRGPHGAAEPDPAVVADAAADQLTLL